MNEEVQFYLDEAKERMEAALSHLESELSKIRAGRANPKILQDVLVDYYGSPTPLSQVANISTPDPRTIAVQPWEKSMISPIERAIIRINIPPLTEERRRDLVKQSKGEMETAKVSIRNARRDVIEQVKKMVKDGLPEDMSKDAEAIAQKMTDEYGKKADEYFAKKEKDIMTI